MSSTAPPDDTCTSPDAFCDALFGFLRASGGTRYDENVTQLDHARQTAALATAADAPDALVVAALLHDIGHLLLDEHHARPTFLTEDLGHEAAGSRFLAHWFGPAVAGPVALHVLAKRHLVATEPHYLHRLSASSVRSLHLQGGPFLPEQARRFSRLAHAQDAVALRRWDDNAKRPGHPVADLEHWRPVIRRTTITRHDGPAADVSPRDVSHS